jgi:hypothetical protein
MFRFVSHDFIFLGCQDVIQIEQLSRHIQQSFRPTQATLTRIKRLTLESGLLTSTLPGNVSHIPSLTCVVATVALAYVILSTIDSNAFIIPGLALSKVYGNSTLALLNGRLRIPGGRNGVDSALVVDHLAERQPEPRRHDSGTSASLLPQPGFELEVYNSRH